MARTAQLQLPLIAPAQAQKHVTVNEALTRLDAIAQLRIKSFDLAVAPSSPKDGDAYLVNAAPVGAWAGQAGKIAIWNNGGWIFLLPKSGWKAWDESAQCTRMYHGSGWMADAVAVSPGGAGTRYRVIEFDHVVVAGATNSTAVSIPGGAQVIGVTGRVVASLSGSGLTGWRLGVEGSDNRYGSGLGLSQNSYLLGLSGSPVTYYSETPILLTSEGGNFAGGTIRLSLHVVQLEPPKAI
jgi:hypothetical protein